MTELDIATDVLNRLKQLKEKPTTSKEIAKIAEKWVEVIEEKQEFLKKRSHSIVFIGNVGVGKSSLIAVVANLLIENNLTDKKSLKDNSILATGAGRTTVCEVHIRAPEPDDDGKLGLLIKPIADNDMETEIAIYAETEWYRRQPDKTRRVEDDAGPTPQEIRRAIRNMTGYAERQETIIEGEKKQRHTVDPLDKVISNYSKPKDFSDHLVELANLNARTETAWWWNDDSVENLRKLKTCFDAINQGKEQTAMLPRSIAVVVPDPLPGSTAELELSLIDTRGLDGEVESRADLYKYLRDSRALVVLCTSFKDAPNDSLRGLLRTMSADAELRQAIQRTLVILLDFGDAEQVNGANDDREFGQALKIGECHRALEETKDLSQVINKERIIAFDALKDNRSRLQNVIDESLSQLRQTVTKELDELIKSANTFVENVTKSFRPKLCDDVDRKLKETMAQHLPSSEIPLHDPLAGLYEAIERTRYASVVYAACRREGDYDNLNFYTAIRAKASRIATAWLNDLISAVNAKLSELQQDNSFASVYDHISLRKRQYDERQLEVIRDYAKRIGDQIEEILKKDKSIWGTCIERWGYGKGFKDDVLTYFKNWIGRQQGITAHEIINAKAAIPLLAEVYQPPQAPQFTLHIRNLRALTRVDWSPELLSVIIGANGTGKTTLLFALKLLRVAYERGLPEAISQILGGSNNLKTWGISEEVPIEIGLEIGSAKWIVRLVAREGSVNYLTHECLTDKEREIFSRDTLGTFLHGGKQIELTPEQQKLLGLRVLMDRGVIEPALRKVSLFLQRIAVYHDPDLWTLRHQGSKTSEDRILHSRGVNAISLLRRWYQDRINHDRYRFVVEGLATAFPNTFKELDFIEAGNTLVARIYCPGRELPSPLADEANGVLQLLILFCTIAGTEDESVVAIDEPENSLHPYALRAFLRRTSRWARQHKLTVLLATHSTVLLDELSATPEQVYVMKANEPDGFVPTRLDQLCDREWLKDFKLGDLYEQGEIGSNEDEV
ncbi:MAG: hypothetical protein BWK79_14085 [Beggiatoa sp. IS2]|nr:MAG: hypothetical protein BWK79_14085 [Beggiatoa sp. IS2]